PDRPSKLRISGYKAAPVAIALASSAIALFPPDSRSAMMPDPTTAASSRAVPTPSATRRRFIAGQAVERATALSGGFGRPLIAAAGAGRRGLRVELCDFGGAAAAGRETAARLAEFLERGAAAVNRGFAIGVEGFPRNALRVGDPLLVRLRVAAGRRLLFEHRALGLGEPAIDLGEL